MEQFGTKNLGANAYSQLFRSTNGPTDIVPCVIVGSQAATYPLGCAMRNNRSSDGLKIRYTNGDSLTGDHGACILMSKVVTTSASGYETTDGCRDGSVNTALVVDANGAAIDAGFKAALPHVSWD
jgi:hypothetical protein